MKNKDLKNISCWVVSEGMAGTENQCIAVAESLGVSFEVKRIALKQPWKSLSPYIAFERAESFSPPLEGPWPDLVIASGRKAIAASRFIKKASGGKSFTVQVQDPRVSSSQFDLVAVPHHDPTRGDNVIVTDASPNRVTQEGLQTALKEFPQLDAMNSPRVAVLIGGSSKAYTMNERVTNILAAQLRDLDAQLMVTSSRRTGANNEAILRQALPNAYFYDGSSKNGGPNPYFAMLAAADFILVTTDSASMISDACSTGKPVYMIPLEGGHPRIDKLHKHLQDLGVLKVFNGNLETFSYEPLNDALRVADAIRERMNNE